MKRNTMSYKVQQFLMFAGAACVLFLAVVIVPFIYGIYPYTSVTEKQKAAMEQAEIPYVYQSAYDLTCTCLKKLLNTGEA